MFSFRVAFGLAAALLISSSSVSAATVAPTPYTATAGTGTGVANSALSATGVSTSASGASDPFTTNFVSTTGGTLNTYSGVTVSFSSNQAKEELYFSGDGSSKTKPLIGVFVDYTLNTVTNSVSNAQLNGLFEFANAQGFNGVTNPRCCLPIPKTVNSITTNSCTTSTSTTFTIASGGSLAVNFPTQIWCTLQNKAVTFSDAAKATLPPLAPWVEVFPVASSAAPIAGQINWLADGPQAGNTTVLVPLIEQLSINADTLSTIVPAGDTDNWLVVLKDANGNNELESGTQGFIAFDQVSTGTTDSTAVASIIGCSIKAGNNFITVNDATRWLAPTDAAARFDYYPTCYFHAVQEDSKGNKLESVVVSVQVHIGVLGPCAPVSSTNYNLQTIANTFFPAYSKYAASAVKPLIFDAAESVTTVATLVSKTITLPYGTVGTATQAFPFYSLLAASSEFQGSAGLMLDPIGYYFNILSTKTAPVYTTGINQKLVPAASVVDQNKAILCFELDYDFGDASFDADKDTVLVNDLTQFGVGKHEISCNVWDLHGHQATVRVELDLKIAGADGHTGCGKNGASACGDPQFTGFLGQSYQVHGVSGQVYNVLSTPSFQYNALFTYLSSGLCRSGTQCFSHPGNYFGEVGMVIKSEDGTVTTVRVIAGPVKVGLSVLINDVPMTVSSKSIKIASATLTLATPFDLEVEASEFSLRLSNSDMFINQDVAINSPLLRRIQHFKQATKANNASAVAELQSTLPHGLLGQTWQYKTYANRWKYIEGTLFEYSVSDGVTGTGFKYNRF